MGDLSSIPNNFARKIAPPNELPVTVFLALAAPRMFSAKGIKKIEACYSAEKPNHQPAMISEFIIPDRKTCEALVHALDNAIENRWHSFQHPSQPHVRFPLWVPRAYLHGHDLRKGQHIWAACIEWLEDSSQNIETWNSAFIDSVAQSLARCPWNRGFEGLQGGVVSLQDLAKLLSNRWLDDDLINCLLDVVRFDQQDGASAEKSALVASTFLGQAIRTNRNSSTATFWANQFKTSGAKALYLPMNIKNIHWIAVGIDVVQETINIGDSDPAVTAYLGIAEVLDDIKLWLYMWPDIEWRVNLTGLSASAQSDTSSCGVTTSNAIHRAVVRDAPIWTADCARWSHAYYFSRCIEIGHDNLVCFHLT